MNKINKSSSISPRAEQLQFLRFLAFLNVFMLHAQGWNSSQYPTWHGAVSAVSFFFILSGLVTGYSSFDKETSLSFETVFRDLWKKLRKVYPLYFVTTLIKFVDTFFAGGGILSNFDSGCTLFLQLAKKLLMIQTWFPEDYYSFNGASWFLATLMFLTLWNVPMRVFLNKIKRSGYCVPVYIAVMGALFVVTTGYCYLTWPLDMEYWQYVLPIARSGEYLMGITLGYLIRTMLPVMTKLRLKKPVFTALEVLALAFWVFCVYKMPGNYWMNRIVSRLIPNLLLLSIFALGFGLVSDFFRLRPLVHLGDITFECFMVHQMVIGRYADRVANETVAQLCALFLCVLISVAIAQLVHKGK